MIIPKKHKIWLTIRLQNNEVYKITSDKFDRKKYFLYKQVNINDYILIGTSNNPLTLENKYIKYS